ncbi:MAG: hypothetical protein DMG65_13635 [Candidatus Angelobacter sp. Gp1-AA117]|nr:MAG: hypothetical protein DMG65_13635 [Candidatus Angelobacter sp. Gp1-AA117]
MPKPILKRRTSSGKNSKTHLKVAAVINAVTRLVPGRRKSAGQGGITAYIPNRLRVGNPVIIELTFPRSGQTFAMQGSVRSIERCPAAAPALHEACAVVP